VKKTERTKKKIAFLTIVVACIMVVVLSMFFVQAFSAQAASKAQDVAVTQPKSDSFSAIPFLLLVLPVATLAAYVLEWTGSKKSSSAL
jgi:heme/copper-type cytochrome/quinol oxidase subunit 2